MKESLLYIIVRPIVSFIFKILYRPKIIGKERIPRKGRIVLAGNHKNNFDCVLLMSSTKRCIHFLAKDELWKGLKKIIFANMGLIPVNRREKSHHSLVLAEEYLKDERLIGIFPEGTFNRTQDTVMPFKIGAVKMAYDTNTPIIPFVITGDYHLFSKNLQIEFLDPIWVKNEDLTKENDNLRNIIKTKLEG